MTGTFAAPVAAMPSASNASWILALVLAAVACGEDREEASGNHPDAASSSDASSDTGSDSAGGEASHADTGSVTPACPSTTPLMLPSVDDEKATYALWGWSWNVDALPDHASDADYVVVDPDIHGDTEGDDLWSYLFAYRRTLETGYLDRAKAWAAYFKDGYRTCAGSETASFCYDRDAFGLDHLAGWGLIAWAEVMDDPAALTEAEALGGVLEALYAPDSAFGCLPKDACLGYGTRQVGRHLLLVTRLAEVTGQSRWSELRDHILSLIMNSSTWDAKYGSYFLDAGETDALIGAGKHASGARIQAPFMLAILVEALDQAYRTTQRAELRERMVDIARHVDAYGLDPTYDYTGSRFGVVDGAPFHNYSAEAPVTFWDPSYTTSLVNVLVRGCVYSGDAALCERAKHFFGRGNRGIYGEPVDTAAGPTEVHHFVDTRFASATGDFYLDFNKGELQYTYLLFDPCVRDTYF